MRGVLKGNVCEIYYRDMTKGFVAGASPRIGCGKCLKDALQENVPRICRGDMSQGCVSGKGPRDKLYYKY